MERLFSRCTRMHDALESERIRGPAEGLQELNLDVSTEDFLSTERAFTFSELYGMLGNQYKVVWLTPHAAVMPVHGRGIRPCISLNGSCRFCFSADGEEIVAVARSSEHILEICDVVLRLLAASVVHSVSIHKVESCDAASITTATLAYLMEQCQGLKVLSFVDLEIDEDHCRVLGAYSRPELEINLYRCKVTSTGASAMAEVLGRNQGPTNLVLCNIDNSVLADGLRGNSRLKSLRPSLSHDLEVANQELLAIGGALKTNKGLIDLNLCLCCVSDETWHAICDFVKTHPTLEVLNLWLVGDASVASAVLKSRIQALVDMMKVSTSIHTIHVESHYSQHELYRESVIPYLETNRLRPLVRAIQKTRPIAYRTKVLGRALLSARTDVNRFWMLLSGNAEIAFPSTTTTTTPAANLPTPAAGTATST
jgi:hypothetical protein